jgi:hypothetical protein
VLLGEFQLWSMLELLATALWCCWLCVVCTTMFTAGVLLSVVHCLQGEGSLCGGGSAAQVLC